MIETDSKCMFDSAVRKIDFGKIDFVKVILTKIESETQF
jgi:hypothetical protein